MIENDTLSIFYSFKYNYFMNYLLSVFKSIIWIILVLSKRKFMDHFYEDTKLSFISLPTDSICWQVCRIFIGEYVWSSIRTRVNERGRLCVVYIDVKYFIVIIIIIY